MTRINTFIFALLAAFTVASATCFSPCKFNFCDGRRRLRVGEPDKPLTGPICMGTEQVGIINTAEAWLVMRPNRNPTFTPISQYYLTDLKQSFSSSFFKTFDIPGNSKFSGVGHEIPQQNQLDFLDRKCWALPISAFQILGDGNNVVNNVHPRDYKSSCISFRSRV